jgi:hypothetical protein
VISQAHFIFLKQGKWAKRKVVASCGILILSSVVAYINIIQTGPTPDAKK